MVTGFPAFVFRFSCGVCLTMRLFELSFAHPARRVLLAYISLYGRPLQIFEPGCLNTKAEFIPQRFRPTKTFWSRKDAA
jgi:hypothetical protein